MQRSSPSRPGRTYAHEIDHHRSHSDTSQPPAQDNSPTSMWSTSAFSSLPSAYSHSKPLPNLDPPVVYLPASMDHSSPASHLGSIVPPPLASESISTWQSLVSNHQAQFSKPPVSIHRMASLGRGTALINTYPAASHAPVYRNPHPYASTSLASLNQHKTTPFDQELRPAHLPTSSSSDSPHTGSSSAPRLSRRSSDTRSTSDSRSHTQSSTSYSWAQSQRSSETSLGSQRHALSKGPSKRTTRAHHSGGHGGAASLKTAPSLVLSVAASSEDGSLSDRAVSKVPEPKRAGYPISMAVKGSDIKAEDTLSGPKGLDECRRRQEQNLSIPSGNESAAAANLKPPLQSHTRRPLSPIPASSANSFYKAEGATLSGPSTEQITDDVSQNMPLPPPTHARIVQPGDSERAALAREAERQYVAMQYLHLRDLRAEYNPDPADLLVAKNSCETLFMPRPTLVRKADAATDPFTVCCSSLDSDLVAKSSLNPSVLPCHFERNRQLSSASLGAQYEYSDNSPWRNLPADAQKSGKRARSQSDPPTPSRSSFPIQSTRPVMEHPQKTESSPDYTQGRHSPDLMEVIQQGIDFEAERAGWRQEFQKGKNGRNRHARSRSRSLGNCFEERHMVPPQTAAEQRNELLRAGPRNLRWIRGDLARENSAVHLRSGTAQVNTLPSTAASIGLRGSADSEQRKNQWFRAKHLSSKETRHDKSLPRVDKEIARPGSEEMLEAFSALCLPGIKVRGPPDVLPKQKYQSKEAMDKTKSPNLPMQEDEWPNERWSRVVHAAVLPGKRHAAGADLVSDQVFVLKRQQEGADGAGTELDSAQQMYQEQHHQTCGHTDSGSSKVPASDADFRSGGKRYSSVSGNCESSPRSISRRLASPPPLLPPPLGPLPPVPPRGDSQSLGKTRSGDVLYGRSSSPRRRPIPRATSLPVVQRTPSSPHSHLVASPDDRGEVEHVQLDATLEPEDGSSQHHGKTRPKALDYDMSSRSRLDATLEPHHFRTATGYMRRRERKLRDAIAENRDGEATSDESVSGETVATSILNFGVSPALHIVAPGQSNSPGQGQEQVRQVSDRSKLTASTSDDASHQESELGSGLLDQFPARFDSPSPHDTAHRRNERPPPLSLPRTVYQRRSEELLGAFDGSIESPALHSDRDSMISPASRQEVWRVDASLPPSTLGHGGEADSESEHREHAPSRRTPRREGGFPQLFVRRER